ncbi:MAG TPA: serine hydrolase [Chryseolinea sp.]|nr:serine hydrolase [Chryseolinea sp.]
MIGRRKFLKELSYGGIGIGLLAHDVLAHDVIAQPLLANAGFGSDTTLKLTSRFSPESQGVSSQGLINFFDAVDKSGLEFHSIMVNRNGKTILEGWWQPFKKEYIHTLYSLSKSFTSTAVGMLKGEGKIDVNDKVISFFPDKLPSQVSDNLAAMRVYDLLTMHTGHDKDTMERIRTAGGNDWVKNFLQLEVSRQPGSLFLYNTGATYMLSAIVQKITGQNVMTYLKPRLFTPLEIEGADWETDPQGINVGGYGLRIRTQDILNFGQLYLQNGEWKGKQLLSKEWISEATKKQVNSQDNSSDWGQGYGYQFWRCKPGCYRGDGAYGQYCIVVPEKNAVIAITSETKDMGASMQLVWDHILPAMDDVKSKPENKEATQRLTTRCAQLSLPINGTASGDALSAITGKRSYTFDANKLNAQKISFSLGKDECDISITENGNTTRIKSGYRRWLTADNKKEPNTLFAFPGRMQIDTKFSSNYYWAEQNKLVVTLKYVENAHTDIFTFAFTDGKMEMSFNNSISIMTNKADERPAIPASQVA